MVAEAFRPVDGAGVAREVSDAPSEALPEVASEAPPNPDPLEPAGIAESSVDDDDFGPDGFGGYRHLN